MTLETSRRHDAQYAREGGCNASLSTAMMDRRSMLSGMAGLAASVVPSRSADANRLIDRSRLIWLRNQAGEEFAGAFRGPEGVPAAEVMERLRHLFRDLRAEALGPLPVALVDVLSLIQAGWRHERPLLLHSGYRTRGTNALLEGAARASLHLEGQAADFGMRGISLPDLAEAASAFSRIFSFMGVGIYRNFVHVDVGPRRMWRGD
ncbi:YcbK family protein [Falsiroseomonas sp. E2-1-a4]|uniref:YcbK family protein n=1 Tax=Falsiroseomonas sp. E2-1-a4 TaxID=3239299 RepID=UPI003F2D627C